MCRSLWLLGDAEFLGEASSCLEDLQCQNTDSQSTNEEGELQDIPANPKMENRLYLFANYEIFSYVQDSSLGEKPNFLRDIMGGLIAALNEHTKLPSIIIILGSLEQAVQAARLQDQAMETLKKFFKELAKVIHMHKRKFPPKAVTGGEPRIYVVKPHIMFQNMVLETEVRDDYSALLDQVLPPCGIGRISICGIKVDDQNAFDEYGHLTADGYEKYWQYLSDTVERIDKEEFKGKPVRKSTADKATNTTVSLINDIVEEKSSQPSKIEQNIIPQMVKPQSAPGQVDQQQKEPGIMDGHATAAANREEYEDYLRFCQQRNAYASFNPMAYFTHAYNQNPQFEYQEQMRGAQDRHLQQQQHEQSWNQSPAGYLPRASSRDESWMHANTPRRCRQAEADDDKARSHRHRSSNRHGRRY